VLVSAIVMMIFYIMGRRNVHKTAKVALAVSLAYFAYYLYHFFTDVARRYVSAITATGQTHQYFTALHLLIFLTLTIAFYVTGFVAFAYKALWKQKV
jgi:purine-cytosine permease-like protein